MTIHNKQWHNVAVSEARALGDIMSESTGGIISECPGDFIGIRNRDMRKSYLVLVIILGLLSPARSGDELDAARALIRSQVDAIGRSAAAYAFASPGIQKIFPGSDAFLKMVKDRYPPIYRHKLFSFGDSHEEGGQIAQEVLIIDADGTTWKGLYTVEHEAGDGSLKVSGCVLVQAPGQPV